MSTHNEQQWKIAKDGLTHYDGSDQTGATATAAVAWWWCQCREFHAAQRALKRACRYFKVGFSARVRLEPPNHNLHRTRILPIIKYRHRRQAIDGWHRLRHQATAAQVQRQFLSYETSVTIFNRTIVQVLYSLGVKSSVKAAAKQCTGVNAVNLHIATANPVVYLLDGKWLATCWEVEPPLMSRAGHHTALDVRCRWDTNVPYALNLVYQKPSTAVKGTLINWPLTLIPN